MVVILTAFILDLCVGDPYWFPHPVKIIGFFIERLESVSRRLFSERMGGTVMAILVVSSTYLFSLAAIKLFFAAGHFLGVAASVFLIYTSLSIKSLYRESMMVYSFLSEGRLGQAKCQLSTIVGRDTDSLNEDDIIRATVETVAESTVDGIISPLFFAFLGGAPLAVAYKAVNTLDSMVGHKDEQYKDFGWFSARMDDFANFIPARISGILIPLACFIMGKRGIDSFKTVFSDGKKNPSPNSGIPEAALAGALGIRLGGTSFYRGEKIKKPYIGKAVKEFQRKDIKEACFLMLVTSFLSLLTIVILTGIFFKG